MKNPKKAGSNDQTYNKPSDLEEYLRQLPPPPEEHTHELRMEKHFKHILKEEEAKLTDRELTFYSRQITLDEIGYKGQQRLKRSHVCIVGLGGLGSVVAIQLAAMGVGHLRLVDRDFVEMSNMQRQHLYSFDNIGLPKVEAALSRLGRSNPFIKQEAVTLSINEYTAERIVSGTDVVVDGLDNMNSRYAINRACVSLRIPYIFGAATSTFGNASTIIPYKSACLECFYGSVDDKNLPTCATIGVHPSVIGIIASIEVAETIRILLEKPPALQNKLLHCDVNLMHFEEIDLAQNEKCSTCGSHPKGKPAPLSHSMIEEDCGRDGKRVVVAIPKEDLNLPIDKLANLMQKKRRIQPTIKGRLGSTFETEDGITIRILKSGVTTIEGAESKTVAVHLFKDILVDLMNIPWSRITW